MIYPKLQPKLTKINKGLLSYSASSSRDYSHRSMTTLAVFPYSSRLNGCDDTAIADVTLPLLSLF
jgi:hypothetical protein